MNDYNENYVALTELTIEVDRLRNLLIENSELESERKEYYSKLDQLKFLMEELIIFESEEESEY